MDNENSNKELQLKVAFWVGFAIGVVTAFLGVVGIGAVTAMAGAF